MKETENKAKMQPLKKESVQEKNNFTILSSKWYENEFLWFIWTDMNQKKPSIASLLASYPMDCAETKVLCQKMHRKMCPNCMFDYSSFE